MADSTTNIDTIVQSQAGKEITANAFFDAASPATLYGRRASTCAGLTWGYYGGHPTLSGGTLGSIANGTLSLTGSATNYIVALKSTGAVSVSTTNTNWNDTTNYWRLYSIVAGSSSVTSYSDYRELGKMTGSGGGGSAITAKDEGSDLTTALASLNFAGAGVTATTSGNDVTVTIPGGGGREMLSASRTYYVRTDGSDSNNGLANTSGGAFLTVQKAVDVICNTLDVGIYTVTIQVADGTYTGAVTLKEYVGGGVPVLQGNTTTPANCIISTTSSNAITNGSGKAWTVQGFKTQTTTSGSCLVANVPGSVITFNSLNFGSCAGIHIQSSSGSLITANGNYAISAAATRHWGATEAGVITASSRTVTITGTPAFSTAFAYGRGCGIFLVDGMTFSGTATGTRYNMIGCSYCHTNGGGATYLPGDVAGTTSAGGQYA